MLKYSGHENKQIKKSRAVPQKTNSVVFKKQSKTFDMALSVFPFLLLERTGAGRKKALVDV